MSAAEDPQAFRRQLIATLAPLLCEDCLLAMQQTMGVEDDELATTIVEQFGENWLEEEHGQ